MWLLHGTLIDVQVVQFSRLIDTDQVKPAVLERRSILDHFIAVKARILELMHFYRFIESLKCVLVRLDLVKIDIILEGPDNQLIRLEELFYFIVRRTLLFLFVTQVKSYGDPLVPRLVI